MRRHTGWRKEREKRGNRDKSDQRRRSSRRSRRMRVKMIEIWNEEKEESAIGIRTGKMEVEGLKKGI